MKWIVLGACVALCSILVLAMVWERSTDPTPANSTSGPVLLGPDIWTVQTGAGGWGNQELQTYTADAVGIGPDGRITITARITGSGAVARYTSGRITSAGKWSFTTGRLTARIRLPQGQGLLPAFWLLGDDLSLVGWPACGEIDVVEAPNTTRVTAHGVHGPDLGLLTQEWRADASSTHDRPLAAGYHDFSVERMPGRVSISDDGREVFERRRDQLSSGQLWVFDQPSHIVFSLAIGGVCGPAHRTGPPPRVLLGGGMDPPSSRRSAPQPRLQWRRCEAGR